MQNCQVRNFLHQAKNQLSNLGFDIFQPFPLSKYNQYYSSTIKSSDNKNLKPYEYLKSSSGSESNNTDDDDNYLAILIGNGKNLWPHFKNHLVQNELIDNLGNFIGVKNPLDTYTLDCIGKVMGNKDEKIYSTIAYYSHEFEGNYPRVAIQVAGQVSGFAFYENETSFLSFHPEFGNWFAYRAVVVLNVSMKDLPIDFFQENSLNSMERVFEISLEKYCQLRNEQIKLNHDWLVKSLKNQLATQLNHATQHNKVEEWIKLRDIPIRFLENQLLLLINNEDDDVEQSNNNFAAQQNLSSTELLLMKEWIKHVVETWKFHRYDQSQILYHYVKKSSISLIDDSGEHSNEKCCC